MLGSPAWSRPACPKGQRAKKIKPPLRCAAGRDMVLFLAWRNRGMGPAQKQPLHVGVGQDVSGGLVQHQSA